MWRRRLCRAGGFGPIDVDCRLRVNAAGLEQGGPGPRATFEFHDKTTLTITEAFTADFSPQRAGDVPPLRNVRGPAVRHGRGECVLRRKAAARPRALPGELFCLRRGARRRRARPAAAPVAGSSCYSRYTLTSVDSLKGRRCVEMAPQNPFFRTLAHACPGFRALGRAHRKITLVRRRISSRSFSRQFSKQNTAA